MRHRQQLPRFGLTRGVAAVAGLLGLLLAASTTVRAEYADVILNKRAEKEGMAPVIFPHWFHRIRFRCKVCHHELRFKMRVGANDINMDKITQGEFCGACHNGQIAWSLENCGLCHSGRPGLKTGIRGGHETGGPGYW